MPHERYSKFFPSAPKVYNIRDLDSVLKLGDMDEETFTKPEPAKKEKEPVSKVVMEGVVKRQSMFTTSPCLNLNL